MITIPTKNNFNRNSIYHRFKVRSINLDTKERIEFEDIYKAADYVKRTRPVKASRSALRNGIFKASNPNSRRGKYLGLRWETTGENVYSREIDQWLPSNA